MRNLIKHICSLMLVLSLNLTYSNSYANDEKEAVEHIAKAVMVTKPAREALKKVKKKINNIGLSPWTWTAMTLSYHYQRTGEITTKIVPEWNIKAGTFYVRPDVTYRPKESGISYVLSSTWSF